MGILSNWMHVEGRGKIHLTENSGEGFEFSLWGVRELNDWNNGMVISGLFTWKKKDPNTSRILEGKKNVSSGLHAEMLAHVVNSIEGMKD